jgi:hypothetical protein
MAEFHDLAEQIMKHMKEDKSQEFASYNVISVNDLKDDEIVEWLHLPRIKVPYMDEVRLCEPGRIVFDGYFYLEDSTMPVERILFLRTGYHLVEIIEKKTIEDTSEFGPYDEEVGGRICFFPTALIDLRYRIIKRLATADEQHEAEERIIEMEHEVEERDSEKRQERADREFNEYMASK